MSKSVRTKDLIVGEGNLVDTGDEVDVGLEGYLPRGDKVLDQEHYRFVVGSRSVFAGLEHAVKGMREGGRREANVPPHLAYGEKGTVTVPPNAALRLILNLHRVVKPGNAK